VCGGVVERGVPFQHEFCAAGSALQIAPIVNSLPGTRDLPTVSWPRCRMMAATAQPTYRFAAANSFGSAFLRISSSGLSSEMSAATAGNPSREKQEYSAYRAGSLTMVASRCQRAVRL
jgi:hypothetical protein